MNNLLDIYNSMDKKSDKGEIHSYIDVYESLFAPYRVTAKNILEIGLFDGSSLLLWEKYFSGKVYGIDCSETPHGGMADLRPLINEGTHNIIIADATNEVEVHKHFRGIVLDIVIDDGNHDTWSQLKSYEIFSKYVSDTGIYIIEDIQDIETTQYLFKNIDDTKKVTILDRRSLKGRYDDVLCIITDKK